MSRRIWFLLGASASEAALLGVIAWYTRQVLPVALGFVLLWCGNFCRKAEMER